MRVSNPTIQNLLEDVPMLGTNVLVSKKQGKAIQYATEGLRPQRPPATEGLYQLTPEQILQVRVEQVTVNGSVIGYQRSEDFAHARKIANYLLGGGELPTIDLGLDGNGTVFGVDGQHRLIGAVLARRPVWVAIRRMMKEDRASVFQSQRRAKKLDPDHMVLTGEGPFERYVQEALTDEAHPWFGFVSTGRKAKTRISPYATYQLVVRYVSNIEGSAAGTRGAGLTDRWDRGLADELAPLVRCFGTKATNPLAFRHQPLQAIGSTALWVYRRNDETDYDRWLAHMPKFPFDLYQHLRTQHQFTEHLLAHWNKGLRGKRRVER